MGEALSLRRRIIAVLIGGFLGTISRYLLSQWLQGLLGKDLPYDILLINITGAFVLAFVTVLADKTLIGPTRRLFINVGFLGAYTTFSSMALGCVLLLEADQWMAGLLYLFFSFDGGVLAVWLGDWLGQQFCTYVRVRQPEHLPSFPAWHPTVRLEKAETEQVQKPLVEVLKTQAPRWSATGEIPKLVPLLPSKPHFARDMSKGGLKTASLLAIPKSTGPDRAGSHVNLRPKRQFVPTPGSGSWRTNITH
jgi:fluoride exporter